MTESQKRLRELVDRQSHDRQKAIELSRVDTLTDEQRTELDTIETRAADTERQLRVARRAVEDEDAKTKTETRAEPDAEHRARVELRSKAKLTNFLTAAAQGRMVSGAEHELCAAAGVQGIPIELLDAPGAEPRQRDAEHRAITPAPGTVGINLDPIRPAVFATSIAARLGIEMPLVPSGTFATATITTSAMPAARRKSPHADAGVDATAGALTVQTASPKRVSARLELALEDIAAVGQANFESILRQNLSLALSDELDEQLINGSGSAPNLSGLFVELDNPAAPGATVADFDDFIDAFAAAVEGLWANTAAEVGIVVNPETYRLSLKTFRDGSGGNANRGEISFADYAMKMFGGWWTNKRMPDKAAHIAQAILYRGGRSAMGASAGMRTAVCPHWGEITIDDIYSGAASGVRSFTMHVMLGDVLLVQPDAYAQVSFRVSV